MGSPTGSSFSKRFHGGTLTIDCTNINKIKFCFAKAKSTEDTLLELNNFYRNIKLR